MAEPTTPAENVPQAGHDLSLWFGALGAPALWLCHLQTLYVMVPWACATGRRPVLHLVSAGFLGLTLLGGVFSWREFRKAGSRAPASTTDPPVGRSRLLSAVGMMSSGLFSAAIVAQAIATFMLDPCAT